MKTIYLASIVLMLSISFSTAQQSNTFAYSINYTKYEAFNPNLVLKKQVKDYSKLKWVGPTLIVGGVVTTIVGNKIMKKNPTTGTTYGFSASREELIGLGIAALGVVLIIEGIIVMVVVNRKTKKKVQVQLKPSGALLSYRF